MGAALATNGMMMEGYGPISTAMGGVSQAIDHGNAGMAQNPATLGMMEDGTSRLDVAIGVLGPDVKSSMPGMPEAKSGGTAYIMPAVGYVKRQGAYTYGFGMFAQGGMGTEYSATSFLAAGTGEPVRTELGVGNVIFPLAYQVNPAVTVAASLKFLWASLDMRMAGTLGGPTPSLSPLVTGGSGGGLQTTFGTYAADPINATPARVDFSDNNDFTGAAKATGFGASIGATYRVNNAVVLGASYQFKSHLADMKTSNTAASMTLITSTSAGTITDVGKITVIDFQMPSVLAVGTAWQATPALLLAADLKYIGWADAMRVFSLRYDSATPGMGSVDFGLPQQWDDQAVLNLGVAWAANEKLTLRAGLSFASNPVPNQYVNPLFPAIETNHAMLGFGYKIFRATEIDASLTISPSVTVINAAGSAPETISHSQTNVQFLYSHRF